MVIGARFAPDIEAEFARTARRLGRTKSDIVRDLVHDFLRRRSLDAKLARTVRALAAHDRDEDYTESDMDD